MAFPPMMLKSTLPGVVLPLSSPASPAPAYSRPSADQSNYFSNLGMSDTHLSDNLYHSAHHLHPIPSLLPHSRHSSNASSYSLASPADSPPSASSSSLKQQQANNLLPRTTIRRARTQTSPYPREPHIHSGSDVYSSSSEAEDLQMYLPAHHHQSQQQQQQQQLIQDPYAGMYMHPSVSHIDPMQSVQQQQQQQQHHLHQPVASAAPSQYGRIAMSPDHNLEQLASNVRSATTTSASDRAKQIFVHAWYVCAQGSLPFPRLRPLRRVALL